MQPKPLFPKFWRRQQDGSDAPANAVPSEASVNKSNSQSADAFSGPQGNLLSYEDIYHAAGILNSRSGYSASKVVEMLNNDRIRDLSKDIQRASVLMALDAAGTAVEDLLQDATRRQTALNSYEEGQRRQLEQFETHKARENAEIQAEMDRLTAHYAERIQLNHEQVAREKEALRNWQMLKQNESQRIAQVIELCAKQPAEAKSAAAAATAGTNTSQPPRSNASPTFLSGGGRSN